MPETTELVTFDSGKLGAFTKKERLEMVQLTLVELESWNKNTVVYENMYCIYRFTHMDRSSEKEITQIAVGRVAKIHSCPETGEELYDLKFCPPKGAKAASKDRKDTLYQDITPKHCFNLSDGIYLNQ